MKRIVNALGKLNWWKRAYAVFLLCATTAIASPAQTFTPLHSFDYTADGAYPYAALVQATNGNLYGTTSEGGANGEGTFFEITPSGKLKTLYEFCSQGNCADGASPNAGLIQATNGKFYGTTIQGGGNDSCSSLGTSRVATDKGRSVLLTGCGTVFSITSGGTLTTLYSFCSQGGSNCTDGAAPSAGLVQDTNGDFYGTTEFGGAACGIGFPSCGTIFKISPSGMLTTLHSFDITDGLYPVAALVHATDGNFYGTTANGGAHADGTVFKITPSGTLTKLYSFCSESGCTDGEIPYAGLVQATNGDLYGTTNGGGAHRGGTVFKITPNGMLYSLYSFCSQSGCTDGANPDAGLVQATDGNLYGTTYYGGTNNYGTIFKITPSGTLTTLHSFDSTDGANPFAAMVQDTDGNFYGTTVYGGANNDGTVFSLSVGLGPFVETQPTSGKVGAAVNILGTNLTGATSVTFNGSAATFTVNSTGTAITTTVPSGATTGKVKVTTPGPPIHTLTSNVPFRVTPTISSFSPTSGPVGTSVVVTGESLTGATRVTFGAVKATSFTVDSYTQITAAVPTGAKTGKIGVTTPGGTATSAGTFTVTM